MLEKRIQMKIKSFDEVSVCMHDLRKCSEKIQNQRPSQSQILSFQGSRQMEPRMLEPSVSYALSVLPGVLQSGAKHSPLFLWVWWPSGRKSQFSRLLGIMGGNFG